MVRLGGLVIRGAREQDYVKLDTMFKKYAPSDQDRHLYKILERTEPAAIRLATYGGQVVGCAYGHDHGEGIGVVAGLFLANGFRTANNAEALLRSSLQRLRDRGCSDVVTMVSPDDRLLGSYQSLEFKEWQRKAWSFIELGEEARSQRISFSDSITLVSQEHLTELLKGIDLIPSRFWFGRVTQAFISNVCSSRHAIVDNSSSAASVAVWNDLPALRVRTFRHGTYFLFDKACSGLDEIGDPVVVREVPFIQGPMYSNLIKLIASDARANGIQTVLLHAESGRVSDYRSSNLSFSAPRAVLRLSVGTSLDNFLNVMEAAVVS